RWSLCLFLCKCMSYFCVCAGEVSDWSNNFTTEQRQEMDDVFNKHLAGTRLRTKLNYKCCAANL
uniref:Uncharacterized protein n=1 Tax=Acanthochromis polyacanthus TaxID=80966 RepID=A0A3Q1F3M4_9TELE